MCYFCGRFNNNSFKNQFKNPSGFSTEKISTSFFFKQLCSEDILVRNGSLAGCSSIFFNRSKASCRPNLKQFFPRGKTLPQLRARSSCIQIKLRLSRPATTTTTTRTTRTAATSDQTRPVTPTTSAHQTIDKDDHQRPQTLT